MDVYECQSAALPAAGDKALGDPRFVKLWIVAESIGDVEDLLLDCDVGWPHEYRFEHYRVTDTALGAALSRLAPTDRATMYAYALPSSPDGPVVRIDSEADVEQVAVVRDLLP